MATMERRDAAATGQLDTSAAEVYDRFFVPALFGQWPDQILDAAAIGLGDHVLDVGCGTGILARAAADRVGSAGLVAGVDVNEAMLHVARCSPEPVRWESGTAESLPFPDRCFDRVLSQFALMFFRDPRAASEEMARVLRPDGRVTVATWAEVDESPGYAAMVDLLRRLFGDTEASALLAPFTFGTPETLEAALAPVFPDVMVTRHEGSARFESIEDWVYTDVRGWTLAGLMDDDQYSQLLEAAEAELDRFTGPDGRVSFAAPALVATAPAPAR